MEKNENRFKCKYPDEFFMSEFFLDLKKSMTENLEMIRMYFMAR